jgi:hypothetical protein
MGACRFVLYAAFRGFIAGFVLNGPLISYSPV